jgi:hypothetical protein
MERHNFSSQDRPNKYAPSRDFVNVNLKQFKFTLLGGSCGFHISESMVSISYMFR